MKVTKIAFEQLFPTGPYANMRLGVEVTLDEKDNIYESFNVAKLLVEESFKKINPDFIPPIHDFNTGQPAIVQADREPSNTVEALIQDINSCNELIVLESYKILARTKPEIQEAYDKKYNELKG